MMTRKNLRSVVYGRHNEGMVGKRTVTVSVKMSKEDLQLLHKAAERLWPNLPMPLTRSSLVLALARAKAEEALKK